MLNEKFHTYLDGEMPDKEKEMFLEEINTDNSLKEDLLSFQRIIQEAKNIPVLNPSETFVSDVMAKISRVQMVRHRSLIGFLLEWRSLRWNVASAIAIVLLIVIGSLVVVLRYPHKGIEGTAGGSVMKEPQMINIKFFLDMPAAKEIFLCGDFNDWKSNEIILKRTEETGLWTVTIPLSIDKTYQYMFVVDGYKWVTDPSATTYLDDGFGNKNSVIDLRNIW